MIPDHYVWFVWSIAFLLPWLAAYLAFPEQRRAILWSSLFTMPFGLTEPLFVAEYWNPPSLFNLAQRTGFDIESLIFSFGIGGIGATLYNLLTGRASVELSSVERSNPRHKYHAWALAMPFVAFPLLYPLPWNPIYAAIVAMALGAAATAFCRPDLVLKIGLGAILFVGYYTVFLLGLELTSPGYIERVWNLSALSGIEVAGLPIEELLFAAGFGAYWSSVYEHFTWRGAIFSQGSALS
jgi:lycopene cyclase-like protein